MSAMRLTFFGHVGFFVETRGGSVLCDPWFTPAYFGSWFPFPRNDGLDPSAFAHPTTSTSRISTAITSIPSGSPRTCRQASSRPAARRSACRFSSASCAVIGFEHFVVPPARGTDRSRRTPCDDPRVHLAGRRSARRLADRARRRHGAVLNQNDARPGDLDACARSVRSTRRSCSSRARSGTRSRTTSRRS